MHKQPKWIIPGLLVLAVAGTGVHAADASAASVGESPARLEQRRLINRVDHGRQEVERRGDSLVREANLKLVSGDYMGACSLYRKAKMEFKKFNSPYFNRRIAFCDSQISKCYFTQAQDAMRSADHSAQRGDFETAIKLCREALKYCPEQADQLETLIQQYEKRKNYVIERDKTTASQLLPDQKNQEYQIEVLLEQGRKLIAANELGAAIRKYEEILLLDPYNAAAIKSLEAVYLRIDKIGSQRYNATHRRMLSEVEWKFASPVFPEAGKDGGSINFVTEPQVKKSSASMAVEKKLNEIIIPSVEIDSTLRNAIDTLREEALKNDPAKVGVNFVFLDKNVVRAEARAIEGAVAKNGDTENSDGAAAPAAAAPAAAAPAAAAGDEAAGGEGGNAGAAEPAQEEIVKVNRRNTSPMEILRMLKDEHDVKFKIADGYVIVAPKHVNLGDMESKVINVEIKDFDSDEALKGRLVDFGISFGPGSSVVYDRNLRCVYVTNTPENIKATEKFLEEEYNIPTPMIQVMVKIIEMAQTDINELAFNWQYSINSNTSRINSDGNYKRQTVINESSNELLRYYRPADAKTDTAGPVPDAQLSYVWENSDGTKLVANMFALNWADSGDVLYSPRVTVMDNQAAQVAMGTIRYFPSDTWESTDLSNVAGDEVGLVYTGASPQPDLSEEKYLGVKLTLQPKIKQGRVVEVKVSFPIETFVDWMEFDARQREADGTLDTDGDYYKMPIFNLRVIDSTVQVYDGDTVLVGGVSTDLTKTYHDKIPILGDIPFIGRFFQSRYSEAEKGNMLIFVTCRIVKPDGTAMYPDSGNRPNGLVNFGLYR